MKKIIALFSVLILIFTVFSGCTSQENGYITFKITDTNGEPIEGIAVYGGKHPDGKEIFPAPEIGRTDADGELEWSPEKYGNQMITVGYLFGDKKAEFFNEWVDISKDDAQQNKTISITYPYTPQ